VGKTEVTRQLARILGMELIRFDMSEYMERHTVSRLIGAPPGYVGFDQGGLLTEEINKHPHSVLLMDEIEKAHPDVFNLLLQVMDHGTLTDNNGRKADFRNVVLVMTTNAGAEETARRSMGFAEQDHTTDGLEALKRYFSPEFRNRLDAVVQFGPLGPETIKSVVDKFVFELEQQLLDKKVLLTVDADARAWIAEKGYDVRMGARPMARVIQNHIKKPLANEILFGSLVGGGAVRVTVEGEGLDFDIESAKALA
jgi:ATP-dependent Clp protease ATP-binding subunit ClpA